MALLDRATVPAATTTATAHSLGAFALSLFSRIRTEHHENVFFSPFSITAAMGLVLAGTDGATRTQVMEALHAGPDEGMFHDGLSVLLQMYGLAGAASSTSTVSVANNLWLDETFHVKPAYLELTQSRYAARAELVCFHTVPEDERIKINRAIADTTHQLIKDLLPSGSITTDTRAVLTNAIYFKGTWTFPFDPMHTQPGTFSIPGGTSIKNIPMMSLHREVLYKHAGDYQAIELPYGSAKKSTSSSNLSMVVLLPEENSMQALANVVDSLQGAKGFTHLVDQLFETKVKIFLPRFTMEESLDLNNVLSAMGMSSIFASGANFQRLTDEALIVSKVIHKAVVKVNEEGTEAAAATAVLMKRSAAIMRPDPVFRADHPFVFFIWDRSTRTILFMGQCVRPTAL